MIIFIVAENVFNNTQHPFFFFKDFIYIFREREKERKRNINV